MRAVPATLIAMLILVGVAMPLRAEDPVSASRHVIDDQIKAFLSDDAQTAYSFAAPGIKAKFPDKAAFFAMVKKSYQPVYHPGNYAFRRSQSVGDGAIVIHELVISGQDGKNWRAVYKTSRQPDGSYKIDGVVIEPDTVSKAI
jgi:ketosteroid isomerase-like protein